MINEINYISINELASRVLDNPLLSDINIEQIIRHVLDFMAKFGVNNIYQDKEAILTVQEYRTLLPCDLIRIMQIKDCKSGLCFRQMTSSYIPIDNNRDYELTFKTQGRVLYTSIKECKVRLAYKAKFNNKTIFQFKFIRDIKQGISKEIQKGNIDAILKYK